MVSPRTRRWIVLVALLVPAGALLAVWLARPDPQLVHAQLFQQRLAGDDLRLLPVEQQLELRGQLRSELQQLSSRQRRLLRDERRRLLLAKIDRYHELPKAEQVAFLDREIDRLLALRREENRSAAGQSAERATPSGTADERERSLKQQLNTTPPEQRARLGDYGKQMLERARARGVIGADFPASLKTVLVFY